MQTVTKEMLVMEVANDTRYSQGMVYAILDSICNSIGEHVSHGRRVQINEFGSFKPKHRRPRIGRNPRTGEAVPIPARTLPVFEPSKKLKETVGQHS